jgi:hypothetical protein
MALGVKTSTIIPSHFRIPSLAHLCPILNYKIFEILQGAKITGFDRVVREPMGMGYGLHHDGKDSKEGVRRVEKPVLRFRLPEGEETEEFHLK